MVVEFNVIGCVTVWMIVGVVSVGYDSKRGDDGLHVLLIFCSIFTRFSKINLLWDVIGRYGPLFVRRMHIKFVYRQILSLKVFEAHTL